MNTKNENVFIKIIKTGFVFTFCMFAWIFFRINNLSEIPYFFGNIFSGIQDFYKYLEQGLLSLEISTPILFEILICLVILGIYDFISLKIDLIKKSEKINKIVTWSIYIFIILLTVLEMPINTGTSEFIYFQF